MELIKKHQKKILYFILILAGIFRLYGINWDQGYHVHPDERAIIMHVVEMKIPRSFSEFFSPESPWNPKFFAYGSFPFYLLFFAGTIAGALFHPGFAAYEGINLVGRVLSAFFDITTIIVLYHLGKRFFHLGIGLLAGFFYAISVLPIQLSHFYAVDTPLTCFTVLTVYASLLFFQKPTIRHVLFLALCFALAVATKISAIVLVVPIITTFGLSIFQKSRTATSDKTLFNLLLCACIFLVMAEAVYFLVEPYAFLDTKRFLQDTLTQSEMTKDAFTFPYTLQYVGKIPYVYEIKNIFLFGQGIMLATLSFLGTGYFLLRTIKRKKPYHTTGLIILSFFIPYFLIVGEFKIGFMRYMAPLYPFLCLFAAILFHDILHRFYKKAGEHLIVICTLLFILGLLVWPVSFMNIYTTSHTRVQATQWIQQNIPAGSTLAVEHWDDTLPLNGQERYEMLTLPLYEPDTKEKWNAINAQLHRTDYIIIASHRLYTPLMKLTDCNTLPPMRCYRQTAEYYTSLFSETGNFRKVAEFSRYPTLPFLKIPFYDQTADESFTVYDHPKIMIFKRK